MTTRVRRVVLVLLAAAVVLAGCTDKKDAVLTFPVITVEVAFATDPLATPTWTDVSAYVRSVQIRRGRSRDLEQMPAGTATVVLDNRDRRFDPEYTSGAYHPNVKPMKRVRIRATYATVVYDLFVGFADGWPQSYDPPNDATVELRATDGFKVLARAELPSVWEIEVRADDPVAWWRLGESVGTTEVADSSGHLPPGLYESTPTLGRTGLVANDPGTAVFFEHEEEEVAAISARVVTAFPFTIEAWVKVNAVTPEEWGSIYTETANANKRPRIALSLPQADYLGGATGRLLLEVLDDTSGGGDDKSVYSSVRVDDGVVHHVAGVAASATDFKVYVDGVDRTVAWVQNGVGGVIPSQTWKVGLGGFPDDAPSDSFGLRGDLQDVAVYASALSAARITAHHAAGTDPWGTHDSDQRVTAVLDAVGWPAADRNIGNGQSPLQRASLGTTPLQHLQKVDETENGRLFMAKDGKVRFIGRHELLKPPYTTSQATFGDGAGELPYRPGLRFGFDDDLVRSTTRVSSQGQSTQEANDAASTAAYGPLTLERSGTLYDTPGEMRDAADYLLTQYKDPLLRVDAIEIVPMTEESTLFPQVLGRELADRVTIKRRPQGIGSAISQEALIEGMELSISPQRMTARWYVSPADTKPYWIVGSSALGVSTRLAYVLLPLLACASLLVSLAHAGAAHAIAAC